MEELDMRNSSASVSLNYCKLFPNFLTAEELHAALMHLTFWSEHCGCELMKLTSLVVLLQHLSENPPCSFLLLFCPADKNLVLNWSTNNEKTISTCCWSVFRDKWEHLTKEKFPWKTRTVIMCSDGWVAEWTRPVDVLPFIAELLCRGGILKKK